MVLTGTRFGEIEYDSEDVIELSGGLIGFPSVRTFVVLQAGEETPFKWLQSLEEPALAFLVVDPAHYLPDYAPIVPSHVVQELALREETARLVFTTANIPAGRPNDMTLNLAGPVLINLDIRRGKQIVLDDDAYSIKHRVFPSVEAGQDLVAA
jgi:flagellar assembly factor FliW